MSFKDKIFLKKYMRAYYLKNKQRLKKTARIWRKKNAVKVKAQNKERYWNNRETDLRTSKKYYRDHISERKEYNHNYYIKNKNKIISNINKWQRNNIIYYRNTCRLKEMKRRCTQKNSKSYKYYGGKGIKCLITINDILRLWERDRAKSMKHPTIDRIDNNGNYDISNCRFIENSDNLKKMHAEK